MDAATRLFSQVCKFRLIFFQMYQDSCAAFSWGSNKYGQLGYETTGFSDQLTPVLIEAIR